MMEDENGPEMARSSKQYAFARNSKSDSRYWLASGRLTFHDSANYSARIQAGGKRVWFPLGTANKKSAAAKAAQIYSFIQAHGFEEAVKHYKSGTPGSSGGATVGEFIEAACRISSARPQSLDAYAKAMRRIVSEIKRLDPGRKYDANRGGTARWREKVDAVPLAEITPSDVVAWKNDRLRKAECDALVKRKATVTVNSLIRNAKALFGRKVLPFVEQSLTIARPLPFEGVSLEKNPSLRYVSKLDAFAILAKAKEDLATSDTEVFKVLILALVCGLRRSEIDHLLWRSFDFTRRLLRIESTEFHELKSEDSGGEIDLDEDTTALFRGFRAIDPTASFVINSPNPPRNGTKSRSYRCDAIFKRLLHWLRENGVDDPKPLHTMRKEIGSIIASEHGIFEASRYLRHSDIRITSAFYADKKKTVTPKSFAGLFSDQDSTIINKELNQNQPRSSGIQS